MSAWYYLVKGRPFGPVTDSAIETEIKSSRLHAHDLVYKDRDTIWRELRTCTEFSHLFAVKTAETSADLNKTSGKESHWVLLVRKPDGSGYKQKGPYLSSQIAEMIKNNEILQTDYVWRDGLKEWYKILAVGEIQDLVAGKSPADQFQVIAEAPPPPPPIKHVPQEESKPPAMEGEQTMTATMAPPHRPNEDSAKLKTQLRFIQKQFNDESTTEVVKKKASSSSDEVKREVRLARKRKPAAEASGRRLSPLRYFLELTPVNKTIFVICTAGIVASLLFSIFWYSSYQDRLNAKMRPPTVAEIPPIPTRDLPRVAPQSAPARPPPQPVVAQGEPAAPPVPRLQPQPQANVRHAPTYIQIERLSPGTEAAQIRIISDGSSHYSFAVTIESILGQVLDMPSVYIKRVVKGDGSRIFDFRRQNIPFGQYRVLVESDKAKAIATADFGTATKDFRKNLHAHRKRLSYDQNEERYSFVKTVTRLEADAFKFAQGVDAAGELRSWNDFYRAWRREFERIHNPIMTAINNKNRQKFVNAGMWLELKDTRSAVDKEARTINTQRMQKKPTSSASARTLAKQLTQIREQMVESTLWR